MRKNFLYVLFATALAVVLISGACGGSGAASDAQEAEEVSKTTLEVVKERGVILCGITTGVPGYSAPDSNNEWKGFDVDLCRAVSAAIFGDPDKVEYKPLSAKERFTALQSGEIDVLSRVTTWTLTRDTELGLNFAGVSFYDGQGFIVTKASKINSLRGLNGASICVQAGTTTELNLADYFRKYNMEYELITYDRNEQASASFESGRCDAFTSDQSQLSALRTKFANPDDFVILEQLISKEPLGPVVRHGDDQWLDIVKWTLLAMINAEELLVTSGNVEQLKANSTDPNIKRLLGVEGDLGVKLGLGNDWAYNIVKLVGNYGEVFERHLGMSSPLKISRGYNNLWFRNGLQYGHPIR